MAKKNQAESEDAVDIQSPEATAPEKEKLYCFESRIGGLTVILPGGSVKFQNHTFNTSDASVAEQLKSIGDVHLVETQTLDATGKVVDVDNEYEEKPWRISAVDPASDYVQILKNKPTRFATKKKAEQYRAEALNDDGTNYDIVFARGK